MKKILIVAIFFLAAFSLIADEINNQFKEANELYSQAKYSSAIDIYESLNKSGINSFELYYNLGSSYYKLGDYAYSILYFEKAKKLAPGDEDIDYNLRIANLQIVDKIEPVPEFFLNELWSNLLNFTDSCSWAWSFIILFWLAFAAFTAFYLLSSSFVKKLMFAVAGLFLVSSIFIFFISMESDKLHKTQNSAIIFEPSIYVKASPDGNSTDLFILHQGTKVRLLDEVGEWNKIKIADGNVGWLPKSSIQMI